MVFYLYSCHLHIECLASLVSKQLLSHLNFVIEVNAERWFELVFRSIVVPMVIIPSLHLDLALLWHRARHCLADPEHVLRPYLRHKTRIAGDVDAAVTSSRRSKSPKTFARNEASISWSEFKGNFLVPWNRWGPMATCRLDLSQWKLSGAMSIQFGWLRSRSNSLTFCVTTLIHL